MRYVFTAHVSNRRGGGGGSGRRGKRGWSGHCTTYRAKADLYIYVHSWGVEWRAQRLRVTRRPASHPALRQLMVLKRSRIDGCATLDSNTARRILARPSARFSVRKKHHIHTCKQATHLEQTKRPQLQLCSCSSAAAVQCSAVQCQAPKRNQHTQQQREKHERAMFNSKQQAVSPCPKYVNSSRPNNK